MKDIVLLGSSFVDFSIAFVKSGRNIVGHLLARLNSSNGVEQVFVDDVPQCIITLVELDFT